MKIFRLTLLMAVFISLAGCLESLPKTVSSGDFPSLPLSPTLKDRNAALARAWDQASLTCRSQYSSRGSYCEQLKVEGEFLSCTATRLTDAAERLKYPSPDLIRVWHNCVMTTAGLLKDGYYLTKLDLERRVASCQSRLDPEPEFPIRQTGWLGPLLSMISNDDKEPLRAVMPGDFCVANSRIALPTCEARFKAAAATASPLAVGQIPKEQANIVSPPQQAPVSPNVAIEDEGSKKSSQRKVVNTRDTKAVSARPASAAQSIPHNLDPRNQQGVGAKYCPIPGACGPSVPVDAVKRP